jgi:hypothetical protein
MFLFTVPSCHLRGRTERNHEDPDNTHCLSRDSNLVSLEFKSGGMLLGDPVECPPNCCPVHKLDCNSANIPV